MSDSESGFLDDSDATSSAVSGVGAAENGEVAAVEAGVALFAARVGNELNNPLAAVLAAHEYIRRRIEVDSALASDEKVMSFLDIIEQELASASRVVGDLVDFGTKRPIMRTSFLLSDLAREAVAEVRGTPEVTLENRVSSGLPPVHLDRDKCKRAVLRVLQNAVDAIPPGQQGRVEIDARVENGRAIVEISDDGSGILPDVRSKMHTPLFSTKIKGTGLGLPVAQAFVRRQGGEITFDSRPGERTTFVISLPIG